MIGAGDLQYRLAFDKRSPSDDGLGNTVSVWVEQFRCDAAYRHLRGGEGVMAGRLNGRHVQVVTVRVSSSTVQISTEWRARDVRSGDVFNIRDVTPETDRAFISLLVERGVADG